MSAPTDLAAVPEQSRPPAGAWLQSERGEARRWDLAGSALLGRSAAADVVLPDPRVSRIHARLEQVGGVWTLLDDGVSRNGTWLNGRRLLGRVQLHDRDRIQVGDTLLVFCMPVPAGEEATLVNVPVPAVARVTPAQRAVLRALARPCREHDGWALPATNAQIADELVLSLDAVKTHLRALFVKFGIDALPQNAKRVRLVELALSAGLLDDDQRA